MAAAVLRFAPSPTGMLHLGGLRTALFNYLYARKTGGRFLLRIEDTDQTRTVDGAMESLMNSMKWTGVQYDEGPDKPGASGPYIQSQRSELYQTHAKKLIEMGKGYRCFCSAERLDRVRELAKKAKMPAGYDRHCRHLSPQEIHENLSKGIPYTVRMKVPEGKTSFVDMVHGRLEFSNRTLDDSILLKSDGLPTYHLANIVDDKLMNITHVLRGEEWISSTPKHVILYDSFGWTPPKFGHLPLLMNNDGSKLSKRQNDVHVDILKEKGYLPEALINFVALMGWKSSSTKEFYTMDELITDFSIESINKSPAVVSYPQLNNINKYHISRRLENPDDVSLINTTRESLLSTLSERIDSDSWKNLHDNNHLRSALLLVKDRVRVVPELSKLSAPFYATPDYESIEARTLISKLNITSEQLGQIIESTLKILNEKMESADWNPRTIKESLSSIQIPELKLADIVKGLRYILTGTHVGVHINEVIHFLGREKTKQRLLYYRNNKI